MKIAVSGVGIVSALGIGAAEHLAALSGGRSGIVPCPTWLATCHRLPVGELALSDAQLTEQLQLPGKQHFSRTALLGMAAAHEAIADAGIRLNGRVGLISATSVGGMDRTEGFFAEFIKDSSAGRLRDVAMHDCAASTQAIARYCGITGYTTTISTACSSAANAVLVGARLIRHGILDCAVVGGTDALSAFTLNGFKSLMILDEHPCRPFDATRAGLNLGEGAGYVVLQRDDDLTRTPYCYLSGAANRNDAFHQTASSEEGEGAFLAMSDALEMGGITPEKVAYINVHGTGTPNNDLSEGRALRRLFGDHVPPFSSTKGFTGHTLAAAGGIEAVFAALAIQNGCIYPNIGFGQPIEELGLVPECRFRSHEKITAVLSNSFGFGGNCASLLFTR